MPAPESAAPPLIGEARALLDTLAHVSAAAPLDRPLLVIGERGVGKELIAARVHFLSRRWDHTFLKLNCAALSDDLLESELFGHEPGAFTGAVNRHVGRFERADGGTLFLDEIAAASSRAQEKILRVIEYGEYERLGGSATLTCDVRVVSATNVDLPSLTAAGRFRADLLDRLAFDVVTVPPLRARKSDIPVLAAHFGQGIALELGAGFRGFAPEALARLTAWDWPGNVRELKNAVERSVYRHFAAGSGVGPVADVCLDPFESPYRPAPRPVPASTPAASGVPDAPPPPRPRRRANTTSPPMSPRSRRGCCAPPSPPMAAISAGRRGTCASATTNAAACSASTASRAVRRRRRRSLTIRRPGCRRRRC